MIPNPITIARPYSAVDCMSSFEGSSFLFDILQTITSPVCCLCNTIYNSEAVRVLIWSYGVGLSVVADY